MAQHMRRQITARIGADHRFAEMDAGDPQLQDGGVAGRCQLAVQLDIAGLAGQQAQQVRFIIARQHGRQRLRGGLCVHDMRRIGMQHDNWQIGCQQSAIPVKHLAAGHRRPVRQIGRQAGIILACQHQYPHRDGAEHAKHNHRRDQQPAFGNAA